MILCRTVEDSLTESFWATDGFLDEPSGSMISPSESAAIKQSTNQFFFNLQAMCLLNESCIPSSPMSFYPTFFNNNAIVIIFRRSFSSPYRNFFHALINFSPLTHRISSLAAISQSGSNSPFLFRHFFNYSESKLFFLPFANWQGGTITISGTVNSSPITHFPLSGTSPPLRYPCGCRCAAWKLP